MLGEGAEMSGEAHSRTHLGLPGRQQKLLDAVAQTGKPIVCVLMSGRPLVIPRLAGQVDALLAAWHGGIRAGRAVADLLFPPRCEVCRQLGDEGLCHQCLTRIRLISPPICHTCGRPLDEAAGRWLTCSVCRHRSLCFTYARAAGVYEGVLREAIHALKFGRRQHLAGPLAGVCAPLGAGCRTTHDDSGVP